MSRSIRFHICRVICSILLGSASLQCLTFQKPEKDTAWVQQTASAGNGLDKRMSMQSLENNLGPSEQTSSVAVSEEPSGVSAEPSGTSLNKAFTAKGETQHTSLSDNVFMGSKSLDVYTPTVSVAAAGESEFSPTGPSKESSENGLLKAMLTTALTTLNPNVEADVLSSTVLQMTVGGSTEAGRSFMDATEGGKKADGSVHLSPAPYLSNEELFALHPKTQNLDVVSDYPTSPLLLAPQIAESELGTLVPDVESPVQLTAADAQAYVLTAKHTFVSTDAPLNLEKETDNVQGSLQVAASAVTVAAAVSVLSDDWDDTKLGAISQVRGSAHEEIKQNYVEAEPPWTAGGDEDDVKRGFPVTASAYATTMKLDKNTYSEPSQVPVPGEVMATVSAGQASAYLTNPLVKAEVTAMNTIQNTEPVTMDNRKSVSLSLPEMVTITDTKSSIFHTLGNSLKGVMQETVTATQETEPTLPAMTPPCFVAQETTKEERVTEDERKPATQNPTVSSVTQLSKKAEHSTSTVSFATTHLSFAKPDTEVVLTDLITAADEEAVTTLAESSSTPTGTRMQVEELTSRIVTVPTPGLMASSVRRTVVPSVRRISTAVTYGLDRLESEGLTQGALEEAEKP